MKQNLVNVLQQIIPSKLKRIIAEPFLEQERQKFREEHHFRNLSYSQEGEDLFLQRFFLYKKDGFYLDKKDGFFIDIGAHHPKRFSNTYIFYQRGWRGINIDAMPNSMKAFNEIRNQDINLEMGVGLTNSEGLNYYIFDDLALNTFSKQEVDIKQSITNYKVVQTLKIPVNTLEIILDKYLPPNQNIDFLSVDVEGLDLDVIKSNNWKKYRPTIVLVESSHLLDIEQHLSSDIALFLSQVGYKMIGKTFKTLFFQSIV